jgi:hypothetical protein
MIRFGCTCGQMLQVGDELANCRARCPKCRAVLLVPAPAGMPHAPDNPAAAEAPTVSSKHDLTINPSEGTSHKKKEPNA